MIGIHVNVFKQSSQLLIAPRERTLFLTLYVLTEPTPFVCCTDSSSSKITTTEGIPSSHNDKSFYAHKEK